MMNRSSFSCGRNARGFSLTEVAIVLGVIGMILGGIWVAVSAGWEYHRRGQAVEQIVTVVPNIRDNFAGQAGTIKGGQGLTTDMLDRQAIPADMLQASGCTAGFKCADNPWGSNGNDPGGTFRVCSWQMGAVPVMTGCGPNLATASQYFAVELTALSVGSCLALGGSISSSSGPTGLVDVVINGTALVENGIAIRPVQAATLIAYCTGAGNTNSVDFVYQLATPPS